MSTSFDSRLGQLFVLVMRRGRWDARIGQLLRSFKPTGALVPLNPGQSEAPLLAYIKGVCSAIGESPLVGLADPQFGVIDSLLSIRRAPPQPVSNQDLQRRAEAWGKWIGALLRRFGLNVDFSLGLDLTRPRFRLTGTAPVVARDPQVVAQCARAYLRGVAITKVIACARDFPGIGSVELDQESGRLLSSKPMAALWREDLIPFRALLPQLPLVMISQAAYKAYDFDAPCPAVWSSEVVTGLLRVKLGYKGVAVARVWPASTNTAISEGVVKSLEAGCDLLIVPGDKSSVEYALHAVRAALDSGKITRKRVEESLRRIRAMKRRLAQPLRVITQKTSEELSRIIRTRKERTEMNEESV